MCSVAQCYHYDIGIRAEIAMSAPLDPHALLARALRTLTDEEQGVVLKHLLPGSGLDSGTATWWRGATAGPTARVMSAAFPAADAGDKVGFLLRLPASTHQALKAWADEHGHSMNVVVRGLVEHFLDERGGGRPAATGT